MRLFSFDTNSRRLFAIGFPIIVQNLVHYLQLQVDMAMLGHCNSLFLAAVGNVTFPYIILMNFLFGVSIGSTVMIAHAIGAKSLSRAKRFSEVSFFYNALISIPFFLILNLFASRIMTLLGVSSDIHLYGSQYMQLLSGSLLFIGIEMSVTATLQGMGVTRHIMISGIVKTAVNILLDWLLIYGRFGLPKMGIGGAAMATTLASAAAMLYLLAALAFSKHLLFRPSLAGMFRPKWFIEKKNIIIGIPTGLEAILWAFAQTLVIRIVNEIDALSAGIYLMVVRIQAVTFFFYIGLARGTMTLVGQKIGAKRHDEAIRVGLLGLRYAFLFCIAASICFLWMPESIVSIFTSDSRIVLSAAPLLMIIAVTIFPIAINVVIGNAIRGMKDTQWMFVTQIFGTVITVCGSALMIFVFDLGIIGVFLTAFADESLRAIINFIRFYKGRAAFKWIPGVYRESHWV